MNELATTLIDAERAKHGAIVVTVSLHDAPTSETEDTEEISALLRTLGIPVVAEMVQRRLQPTARTLLGSGKVEMIRAVAEAQNVHLLIIDHPLSGPQVRNLEEDTGCQVLDRAGIIIDIFSRHAKTNQAKTQVEIARLEYLLPRLTGAWTHFQRQRGGVNARGMGEKQIEIDRRLVRHRIARLHRDLEQIQRDQHTQKKSRRSELKVCLVGYTNSGKTTLMAGLTQAEAVGRDALFATLDSQTKVIDPHTRPRILLSDTVGFIRDLPVSLIASFKSTLEQVQDADLLLHVVNIAHDHYAQQIASTLEVLKEIGVANIPMITVFNKVDAIQEPHLVRVLRKAYPDSLSLSAYDRDDILRLRQFIYEFFDREFETRWIEVDPAQDQRTISFVHQSSRILDSLYEPPGKLHYLVRAPKEAMSQLEKYIVAAPTMTPPMEKEGSL